MQFVSIAKGEWVQMEKNVMVSQKNMAWLNESWRCIKVSMNRVIIMSNNGVTCLVPTRQLH